MKRRNAIWNLFSGRHLLRRVAAMLCALSLVLPLAPAYAYTALNKPVKMVKGEEPTINIELNAVVDAAGELTGELEVALWAKSGEITTGEGDDAVTTVQPFNGLAVALEYSNLLKPANFDDTLVNTDDTSGFSSMAGMETLKKSNLISTAGAMVSAKEAGGGYLVLTAEAHRPVELKELTLLSVVTFQYDLNETTVKDNPPLLSKTNAVGNWLAQQGEALNVNDNALVKFAPASVIDNGSAAAVRRELFYSSSTNDMYWSDSSYDDGTTEDGQPVPKLAISAADPESPADAIKYSKRSNLLEVSLIYAKIEDHKINFSLVNKITYDDSKMKNAVIIEFFDWDDTQIGAIAVPMDKDAREVVNDYVKEHFIHPQLQSNTNYSSLIRVDNYRGKYPTTLQRDGDDPGNTVVANGGDYPLTNKLDYVFFKRFMKKDAADPDVNKWAETALPETEKGEDGKDLYPYIRGWAVVNYQKPETTWTTIGMGELSAYNGANSGGGYHDMGGAAAELTSTDPAFAFANFDFSANSQTPGSVYAVKAVFEPGGEPGGEQNTPTFDVTKEGLLGNTMPYRMTSSPYYSKLNSNVASAGGAYSVDITYERSNTTEGAISSYGIVQTPGYTRGVARARDLIVRQDSTADVKWNNSLLSNATSTTESSSREYVPVTVVNGDVVSFSLTLSARMNRINYYLIDKYNNNFVGGQARTSENSTMKAVRNTNNDVVDRVNGYEKFVLSNYNYYDEDSETEDVYYDVLDYNDREGSLGFVLYGSLNAIMERATAQARVRAVDPTGNDPDFNSYVTFQALNDVNIRPKTGTKAVFDDQVSLRLELTALAKKIVEDNSLHTADYWNAERDCVELSYHQVQLWINEGVLYSRAVADSEAHKIGWCNLHDYCAAGRAQAPEDWEELIAAAKETGAPKISYLVNMDNVEPIAHLRKNPDGNAYEFVDFKSEIEKAVNKAGADTSWENIQALMIGETLPAEDDRNYWWYKGDPKSAFEVSDWDGLLTAVAEIDVTITFPDGSTGKRQFKLNLLADKLTANAALSGDDASAAWIAATHNLCAPGSSLAGGTVKFTDIKTFKTALIGAVTRAKAAGVAAPDWYQIQYDILNYDPDNAGYTFPAVGSDAYNTAKATYYWYDGGKKISDLKSLLTAALNNNLGAPAAWNTLTDPLVAELYFKKNFKGEAYTETADFDTFKARILAMVGTTKSRVDLSWEAVQYYLIHNAIGGDRVSTESPYYWWKDGGDGSDQAVDFSDVDSYSTGLAAVLEAAYRFEINGNTHAWDNLAVDTTPGGTNHVRTSRFVKANNGATTFDGLTHFDTKQEFLDAIDGFAAAAGAKTPGVGQNYVKFNAPDWKHVQNYLLTHSYNASTSDYWWKTNPNKPEDETPQQRYNKLIAALTEFFPAAQADSKIKVEETSLGEWLSDEANLNALFVGKNNATFTSTNAVTISKRTAWRTFAKNYGYDISKITWYEIEYCIAAASGAAKTHSEIETYFSKNGITKIPDFVTSYIYDSNAELIIAQLQKENNALKAENTRLRTENVVQAATIDSLESRIVALETSTPAQTVTVASEPESGPDFGEIVTTAFNNLKRAVGSALAARTSPPGKTRARTVTLAHAVTDVTRPQIEKTNLVVTTERRDATMTTNLTVNERTAALERLSSRFVGGSLTSLFDPGGGGRSPVGTVLAGPSRQVRLRLLNQVGESEVTVA